MPSSSGIRRGADARHQDGQRDAVDEQHHHRMEVGRVPLADVLRDLAVARDVDVVDQQPGPVGRDARGDHAAQQGQRRAAPVWRDWRTPPIRSTKRRRHQRPPQLDPEHEQPDQDRAVRVDPDEAQRRQGKQPARVGPRLGQHAAARAGTRPARSRGPGPRPRRRRCPRRGAGRWRPPGRPGRRAHGRRPRCTTRHSPPSTMA